ncbi:hypothetical protein LZ30DRAFT_785039 [Colletotrichum cereale]|nr:hypothetical protein LZ30DRAFT_785039 [Colletotrichum cereale]
MTAPYPQAAYEIGVPRLALRSAVPDDANAFYGLTSTPENHPSGGGMRSRDRVQQEGPPDDRPANVGYGKFNRFESVEGEVEFAIEETGCRVVRVETDLDNEPWRAVMRSVGLGRLEVRQLVNHEVNSVG